MVFSQSQEATQPQDWLSKIEKDLKGKSPSEYMWNLGALQINPFVLGQDTSGALYHPNTKRAADKMPCLIGHGDSGHLRSEVLKAMEWGAGTLVLSSDNDVRYDEVLEGIDQTLVDVHISPLVLELTTTDLASFCKNAAAILQLPPTPTDADIFMFHGGPHIYLNICCVRAFRICLDQLITDSSYKLIGIYTINENRDLATNLLQAMPAHWAAVVSGVDYLATIGHRDDNEQRLHINNMHLLMMESKIPLHEDIVGGSYYLDTMTRQIADHLWECFINKNQIDS